MSYEEEMGYLNALLGTARRLLEIVPPDEVLNRSSLEDHIRDLEGKIIARKLQRVASSLLKPEGYLPSPCTRACPQVGSVHLHEDSPGCLTVYGPDLPNED
jgi:hypothetical protein